MSVRRSASRSPSATAAAASAAPSTEAVAPKAPCSSPRSAPTRPFDAGGVGDGGAGLTVGPPSRRLPSSPALLPTAREPARVPRDAPLVADRIDRAVVADQIMRKAFASVDVVVERELQRRRAPALCLLRGTAARCVHAQSVDGKRARDPPAQRAVPDGEGTDERLRRRSLC